MHERIGENGKDGHRWCRTMLLLIKCAHHHRRRDVNIAASDGVDVGDGDGGAFGDAALGDGEG